MPGRRQIALFRPLITPHPGSPIMKKKLLLASILALALASFASAGEIRDRLSDCLENSKYERPNSLEDPFIYCEGGFGSRLFSALAPKSSEERIILDVGKIRVDCIGPVYKTTCYLGIVGHTSAIRALITQIPN